MLVEFFGPGCAFMEREELLTFEEIVNRVQTWVPLGTGKIRLTGGEPLLRRGLEDLVAMLAAVEGVKDIAITTNGVPLAHHAETVRSIWQARAGRYFEARGRVEWPKAEMSHLGG